jgi:hypothetical protein
MGARNPVNFPGTNPPRNYQQRWPIEIRAKRFVRRLRGRSCAGLVVGTDGWHYAVKRPDQCAGSARLVTEWLGSRLLSRLGINAAPVTPILLRLDFLRGCGGAWTGQVSPVSQFEIIGAAVAYPANPEATAIYDFIPRQLEQKISNLDHFAGAYVAAAWTAQRGSRQAVFHRDGSFRATMIDHGEMFGGYSWTLGSDPSLRGRLDIHSLPSSLAQPALEPWIEKVRDLRAGDIEETFHEIPTCWLDPGFECRLAELAHALVCRAARIGELVEGARQTSDAERADLSVRSSVPRRPPQTEVSWP